jgi:hypothetical protein
VSRAHPLDAMLGGSKQLRCYFCGPLTIGPCEHFERGVETGKRKQEIKPIPLGIDGNWAPSVMRKTLRADCQHPSVKGNTVGDPPHCTICGYVFYGYRLGNAGELLLLETSPDCEHNLLYMTTAGSQCTKCGKVNP